jgi:hypothetical protein
MENKTSTVSGFQCVNKSLYTCVFVVYISDSKEQLSLRTVTTVIGLEVHVENINFFCTKFKQGIDLKSCMLKKMAFENSK